MRVRWEWKPQDCWIGVFWKTSPLPEDAYNPGDMFGWCDVDIWVCLVPMLPIHFSWRWEGWS